MELCYPGMPEGVSPDLSNVKKISVLGLGASPLVLSSETITADFIKKAVPLIGMTLLDDPHTYSVDVEIEKLGREPFEDEGGVSGVGVLSTSHLALHGWPARGEFHLDVYSCRSFDCRPLLAFIKQVLIPTYVEVHDISDSAKLTKSWREFQ
jgi:S-adenosylmethionine/arginine decarboxylase-like enzyme